MLCCCTEEDGEEIEVIRRDGVFDEKGDSHVGEMQMSDEQKESDEEGASEEVTEEAQTFAEAFCGAPPHENFSEIACSIPLSGIAPRTLSRQLHAAKPAVAPVKAIASSPTKWRYISVSGDPISIRLTPDIEGVRSETDLLPGDVFEVAEEMAGMSGVLFLRMADGTGWVFDQKPGRGVMCVREERAQAIESSLTKWRYISVSGDPISIRLTPDIEGVRSETDLLPGDVFEVAEEM
eukprot:CAMPEP_0177430030 /NCGR_PEP_ID=MMETSP0368-20130122/75429_1 /TAXON_ID=447022 ORGANISM="Scrippsiella hangoei-like, Strain SHHI-4" /NCGR_SAMPLE_ID=MMETSP0368 /ASSEMBLY_ACC=CAM_ASM_000363 /LENGTH=235 /DNA_ID=CAMNT_0018900577 /DNA_START=1 /DNA_END=705 /DNA_ORIENTATION=-